MNKSAAKSATTLPTRLLGYARVSTEDQATDAQMDELAAAGCSAIIQEHGSGASRARPELARLLADIRPGDVLVVVRLDRLARSVSHLLDVIERLKASGAHFRSLRDPVDTSTPQGMFSLQVLGAVAQLERALISERIKAGIKAARARGKLPGNPGLRAKDPAAIAKTARAQQRFLPMTSSPQWIPGSRPCASCALCSPGKMWCAPSTVKAGPNGVSSACAAPSVPRRRSCRA